MAFFNRIKLPNLPVYKPSTQVAWTKEDLVKVARDTPPGGKFVRLVTMELDGIRHKPSAKAAERMLKLSDDLHEEAVGEVGGRVIKHTWGVYRHKRGSPRFPLGSEWLPDGYSFVAKVEAIQPALPLPDAAAMRLQDRIDKFYHDNKGRILPYDIDECQFVADSNTGTVIPAYVDIEPRLARY